MADSDDEYIQGNSDDDADAHQVTAGKAGGSRPAGQSSRSGGWEVTRTWENVVEGADGTINSTVEGLLEAGKRKRLLKDTTPLQRGIIRHLILILDLSTAMAEKDLRPTRYLLTLRYTADFITEFFEQNPISQLGLIGMRDGLALNLSPLSGNPSDHLARLAALRTDPPQGHPSLQNALDLARAALFHAPAHTTREVLLLYGSLLSSDPGDIHASIRACAAAHIACSVIGLAAQVAICATLVQRTNPSRPPAQTYTVALNEPHYRDLLMRATTPPPTSSAASAVTTATTPSLLMMGFPSRTTDPTPTLCACHSAPSRTGYRCARCGTKVCALPTTCPACGLTLLLSTHLARSYHHLFPLRNWVDVSWERVRAVAADKAGGVYQAGCLGCEGVFPRPPLLRKGGGGKGGGGGGLESVQKSGRRQSDGAAAANKAREAAGVSESSRYECESCGWFFCIDCDLFAHQVVHNCPGCLSRGPAGGGGG